MVAVAHSATHAVADRFVELTLKKRPDQVLGINLESGTNKITRVFSVGLVESWNRANRNNAIHPGSMLLEVNGVRDITSMQHQMQHSCELRLKIRLACRSTNRTPADKELLNLLEAMVTKDDLLRAMKDAAPKDLQKLEEQLKSLMGTPNAHKLLNLKSTLNAVEAKPVQQPVLMHCSRSGVLPCSGPPQLSRRCVPQTPIWERRHLRQRTSVLCAQ